MSTSIVSDPDDRGQSGPAEVPPCPRCALVMRTLTDVVASLHQADRELRQLAELARRTCPPALATDLVLAGLQGSRAYVAGALWAVRFREEHPSPLEY